MEGTMPKHVLTISELGESTCWLLVQQAIGIPDARMHTNFMEEKVAVLVFARPSLPERLCVTAAVRQMGGLTVYQGEEQGKWLREFQTYQVHMMPIFNYYLDCLYTYGIPMSSLDREAPDVDFPVINAGSPDAHPAHALADIACMLRASRDLNNVTVAWLGCDNGALHSLVAAAAWFPYSLRVALPDHIDAAPLREIAGRHQGKVDFVESPEEAVRNANYIFAGCRGETEDASLARWELNAALMGKAEVGARLLLGARPLDVMPVDQELLSSPSVSMLVRQSEYRLRVHKRILHWVFAA